MNLKFDEKSVQPIHCCFCCHSNAIFCFFFAPIFLCLVWRNVRSLKWITNLYYMRNDWEDADIFPLNTHNSLAHLDAIIDLFYLFRSHYVVEVEHLVVKWDNFWKWLLRKFNWIYNLCNDDGSCIPLNLFVWPRCVAVLKMVYWKRAAMAATPRRQQMKAMCYSWNVGHPAAITAILSCAKYTNSAFWIYVRTESAFEICKLLFFFFSRCCVGFVLQKC